MGAANAITCRCFGIGTAFSCTRRIKAKAVIEHLLPICGIGNVDGWDLRALSGSSETGKGNGCCSESGEEFHLSVSGEVSP